MAYGHGKVILFGEHAVVHGCPALARAIRNGAQVEATRSDAQVTSLHIAPWNVDVDTGAAANVSDRLQKALKVARAFYDDDVELALNATMHLPGGAGMGSSAALGVAVLRAMDDARGVSRPEQEIYERSLSWERVFHGNPSGVDNAMATHGGLAVFKKGEELRPVVARHTFRLVAGYSGPSPSTEYMVASVQRQLDREPARVKKAFEAIAAVVSNGRLAIEQGDLKNLGQLLTLNHKLLTGLMLSTDKLEEMNEAAVNAGALGAKVTGGGGGGCMIALVGDEEAGAKVRAALSPFGPVYDV